MGKKLNVYVEGAFSPALDNPGKALGQNDERSDIGLNKRFLVGAEWTVSRNRFIGIKAGILPSGLLGSIQVNDTDYSSGFPIITEYFRTGAAQLNAFPIGISTGHSRRNDDYIMPLGHYRIHTLFFIPYSVKDTKGAFGPKGRKLINGFEMAYTFELGKQMIFFDNMTFRYGMQFGLLLTGDWSNLFGISQNAFTAIDDDIRFYAESRLQGALLFNVNVGVGYLLR